MTQHNPWDGAYQAQPGHGYQQPGSTGSSNTPAVWQPQQHQGQSPYGAQQPYAQTPVPFAQQPYGQPGPTYLMPLKSDGIAYLLWFFLGGLGGHHWYLGRPGPAAGQLALYMLGWLTIWIFGLGIVFFFAVGIWLIVDLFLIPGFTREANARMTGFRPY